jgi:hypothetical protein
MRMSLYSNVFVKTRVVDPDWESGSRGKKMKKNKYFFS